MIRKYTGSSLRMNFPILLITILTTCVKATPQGIIPQITSTLSPASTKLTSISSPTVMPSPTPTTTVAPTETLLATRTPSRRVALTPCALSTLVGPTPPAEVTGYTDLDVSTGLHITGKVDGILELMGGDPQQYLASYRLEVIGKVERSLSLKLDELRCLPRVEASPALVCPTIFVDYAGWAGVPLTYVLDLAGLQDGARGIYLTSLDGYKTSITFEEALAQINFLAYEWKRPAGEGYLVKWQPLPVYHGFPLRAVFPDMDGNKWVKWLVKIEVY